MRALWLLCFVGITVAAWGAGPATSFAPLLEQLGDDSFDKREEARRTLVEIGPACIVPASEKQNTTTDLEIRNQVDRLISEILQKSDRPPLPIETIVCHMGYRIEASARAMKAKYGRALRELAKAVAEKVEWSGVNYGPKVLAGLKKSGASQKELESRHWELRNLSSSKFEEAFHAVRTYRIDEANLTADYGFQSMTVTVNHVKGAPVNNAVSSPLFQSKEAVLIPGTSQKIALAQVYSLGSPYVSLSAPDGKIDLYFRGWAAYESIEGRSPGELAAHLLGALAMADISAKFTAREKARELMRSTIVQAREVCPTVFRPF